MAIDWNRLQPLRPVENEPALYVRRPEARPRLADRIEAGFLRFAISGPVGSGKSTELAATARAQTEAGLIAGLVHLGRELDLQCIDLLAMTRTVVRALVGAATAQDQRFSATLRQKLVRYGLLEVAVPAPAGADPSLQELTDAARALLRELARNARPVILIDGLEKASQNVVEALAQLLRISEDHPLIVVLSPAQVTGPAAYEILQQFQTEFVRAVPVREDFGAQGTRGRLFLRAIATRRLGLPMLPKVLSPLIRSARWSGGLPRTFLQLLRNAAAYANLANRTTPTLPDLLNAVADQEENMRLLLRNGDVAAFRKVNGTNGLELPMECRLRLLAQGLLLEYEVRGNIVVHSHPLLDSAVLEEND